MNGELAALRAVVTADTSQYERAMARAATTGRTTASVISRAGYSMQPSLNGAAQGWDRVGRSAEQAGRTQVRAAQMMRGSMIFAAKAAGLAALAVGAMGVATLAVGIKFDVLKQRAQIAFTTMLGSSSQANKFLEQLRIFAARTPFQFADLIPQAQRMMAMGIAAKNVIPYLTAIGNAEALLGGGKEGIDRVSLAIGQMQAKAKVSAEEMRQLTEAGVPAWKYLAQAIFKTQKPTDDMISKVMKLSQLGQIKGRTGVAAIIDGMNRDFGGGMAKLNKTVEGQWSNLKDNFQNLAGQFAAPAMPFIKRSLTTLNNELAKIKPTMSFTAKASIVWTGIDAVVSDLSKQISDAWNGKKPTMQANAVNRGIPASTATLPGGLAGGLGATGKTPPPPDKGFSDAVKNFDYAGLSKTIAVNVGKITLFYLQSIQKMGDAILRFTASTLVKAFSGDFNKQLISAGKSIPGLVEQGLRAAPEILFGPMIGNMIEHAATSVYTSARRLGSRIVSAIGAGISGAWGAISHFFSGLPGMITSFGSAALAAAARLGSGIVARLGSALASIGHAVSSRMSQVAQGVYAAIPAAVSAAISLGVNIASGIMSGLGNLAGNIASSIGGAVSSAISRAKGAAAGLIPGHAAGGVVNHPQLAVVGEGKGREFIIPEEGKYRRRAMSLWEQAGHALGVPGFAAGGVAGRPGAKAYTPRYNWKRFKRSSLDSEQQTAADYDAQTQRWDRYFNRDGTLDAKEEGIMISRMTRYRSMLDRISSKAGVISRRDRAAAKRAKDPQRRSDLLNAASQAGQTSHDTHQASLDLAQDIADRVANRNSLLKPAAPDLAAKLARYDDLDALIQAGMGPKGLTQAQNLANELHYLKTVKGFAPADVARAINDVTSRMAGLSTSGGGGTTAAQPIQSQIDAATQAGFASGFGRLWNGVTGNLSDIGAGQGVTMSVDRLLIAPTSGNYQTMANGANAGNDAQSFRIYSPVASVGAP